MVCDKESYFQNIRIKTMKILVVSHEFPPIGGGGANACYFLTKEYVKAGHKVTVVTSNYQRMPERELINGATVVRVDARRTHKDHCGFGEMADYLVKALRKAKELEEKEAFDICHVFFGIPSGPIGYLLKKRYHLPYVIRFGGGDIPGFQKRFKWVYRLIAPFIRLLWKNADALIANSNELKKFAEAFYSKKAIAVISNGVDTETFRSTEKKDDREEIRLLFVSRLIERKGLQHIIPVLKNIQNRTVFPIRLVIVGDGPYRTVLENLVETHNVKELVQFTGGKTRDELGEYYRNADLFLLPSRMEGMPNVVLEAMASGLPVVMTPCGGSEELITDNGYAVPVDQFEEVIIQLCNDKELRQTMGEASRKAAEEKFGWNQKADLYLNIFEQIMKK